MLPVLQTPYICAEHSSVFRVCVCVCVCVCGGWGGKYGDW